MKKKPTLTEFVRIRCTERQKKAFIEKPDPSRWARKRLFGDSK